MSLQYGMDLSQVVFSVSRLYVTLARLAWVKPVNKRHVLASVRNVQKLLRCSTCARSLLSGVHLSATSQRLVCSKCFLSLGHGCHQTDKSAKMELNVLQCLIPCMYRVVVLLLEVCRLESLDQESVKRPGSDDGSADRLVPRVKTRSEVLSTLNQFVREFGVVVVEQQPLMDLTLTQQVKTAARLKHRVTELPLDVPCSTPCDEVRLKKPRPAGKRSRRQDSASTKH